MAALILLEKALIEKKTENETKTEHEWPGTWEYTEAIGWPIAETWPEEWPRQMRPQPKASVDKRRALTSATHSATVKAM